MTLLLLPVWPAPAENYKEQLNGLIRDTQRQGSRPGRLTLVWWVPLDFWRATLLANGTIPADRVEELVDSISDVDVFIVIDGKFGGFAAVNYTTPDELTKSFAVTDTDGKPMVLIPETQQSTSVKNLLSVMRPVMANLLGDLGKHINFFVFEGKNKNGSRRLDPRAAGVFNAHLGGEEFHWRLPLGSLLPEKVCPKCNETFPGNYAFCPFDSTPLKEKAAKSK